jgi:hypothetical protein
MHSRIKTPKFQTVTTLTLMALTLSLITTPSVTAASNTLIVIAFTYHTREEFVQIKNVSALPVNLNGYCIGDEETDGQSEGMAALPDISLAPGDSIIIAQDADSWSYSQSPDYSFRDNAVSVPILGACTTWSGGAGSFALSDSGDEVMIVDSSDNLIDGACYGSSPCNFNGSGNNTILTDGPLSTSDPGFKRQNDTDTDMKADWGTNPSAVTLNGMAIAPALPATVVALMTLTSGMGLVAAALRRRHA